MNLWIAFSGGLLSFLSPCTLPLIPFYLSYITGKSMSDIQEHNSRKDVFIHSLFFLLGILTIYFGLGLSIQFMKSIFANFLNGPYQMWIQRIAGIIVILMGLSLSGLIQLDFLLKDQRNVNLNRTINYGSSFLVGMGFAAGWTPCIGPIFSAILLLGDSSITYLLTYLLGFSIPFLLITLFISKTKSIQKYAHQIMIVGSIVIILLGILLYTGELQRLTLLLTDLLDIDFFRNLG